jgi:hypothetical protein
VIGLASAAREPPAQRETIEGLAALSTIEREQKAIVRQ